jgi:hypothetical protein
LDKEGEQRRGAPLSGWFDQLADEPRNTDHPAVAVGPGIPSSTEEGRFFSEGRQDAKGEFELSIGI